MRIFFSGIGGVGIGPLAMLAFDAGHFVVGTDLAESDMTSQLKSRGALIQLGISDDAFIADQQNKAPIDWFVYSSALPKDHPEVLFAKSHGIKSSKRDEFINYLLAEKNLKLVAVSGTHGKTTTTGMLVWLFQQLGEPVSYSIGTTISFGPAAQYKKDSKYFIYECDEFDRNFLHFSPFISAVPSLDYDHTDTYPTQAAYDQAFTEFVSQSESTFLWPPAATQLSLNENDQVSILDAEEKLFSKIDLPGEHTRRNAWLAVSVVKRLFPETSLQKLVEYINAFPGTNRRFEKLAENIYTDYAHHPAEIAATIQMAKEVNSDVVIVYQPHQNIRQHEILKEGGYKNCFNGVRKVYWLPTYLSREYKELPVLSAEDISSSVGKGITVELAMLDDRLWQVIMEQSQRNILVLAMSAGNLDVWLRKQVANL